MKRKIYEKLLQWKNERYGTTAILIEGARRVGKSYIVEEFAKNEYKSFIFINFGSTKKEIIDLFENETYDIPKFLQKLSFYTRTELFERESAIILDDVQKCPRAREAIKYLVEDGRYDYIETGSFVSLYENVKDIIIPSEEEIISMFPMDFEEFCWAMGDTVAVPYIKEHFEKKIPMGKDSHKVITDAFRQYMLVGGMPEVVEVFASTKDYFKVENRKKLILDIYREDIGKRKKTDERKISAIFEQIPHSLSKRDKVFRLSDIDKNGKISNYDNSINWLEESMIADFCYDSSSIDYGLYINSDRIRFKCYMCDTGLLVTLLANGNKESEYDIYEALLQNKFNFNEGVFAENIVAQTLRSNGHRLLFHSFYNREQNNNRYEIDFLIHEGKKISAVEVKPSNTYQHSSLDMLKKKYPELIGESYILNGKDLEKRDGIWYLPLYMVICL